MSRAAVPIVCAMVAATYWALEPLVDGARDGWLKIFASDLVIALIALTTLVAVGGVVARNAEKVLRRQKDGWDGAVVVIAFVVTLSVGLVAGPASAAFVWLFDYVYAPLEASVFALVAFALVDTVLRRMRSYSLEAAVLIGTAAVVMLGRAPPTTTLGTMFTPVADWLTRVPNVAGQRVLLIGAAFAAASTLLRVLLGLERDYLGERRS